MWSWFKDIFRVEISYKDETLKWHVGWMWILLAVVLVIKGCS